MTAATHSTAPQSSMTQALAPQSPVSLTRRGRLVLLGVPVLLGAAAVLALLLTVLTSFGNQAQASSHEVPGVETREVTVTSGDTLWSIAASADGQTDIQQRITQIAELNNLDDSQLQPGDVLDVPQP